jgi:hypothetical protein
MACIGVCWVWVDLRGSRRPPRQDGAVRRGPRAIRDAASSQAANLAHADGAFRVAVLSRGSNSETNIRLYPASPVFQSRDRLGGSQSADS